MVSEEDPDIKEMEPAGVFEVQVPTDGQPGLIEIPSPPWGGEENRKAEK